MRKYEITNNNCIFPSWYLSLHQIRALKDIPRHGVKAGDLGGWIESEKNLSHEGDCWISGNAQVFEDARIGGNALVYGDSQVFGNSQVYGDVQVGGKNKVGCFYNLTANMKVETNTWRWIITQKEFEDMSVGEVYEKINVKEWIC
jgi:hypothetical protein